MLMLIDDANLDNIRRMYDTFPCDGVTTNPTILKRETDKPWDTLLAIRRFLPRNAELHVQAISLTAEQIVQEAQYVLKRLGENTYIKIPVTGEGIKAMRLLSRDGVKKITATAIYTAMQAFVAAKAGARYAAPYVNRIDNLGADGVQVARSIHDMFRVHQLECDVIAASFKNSQQILSLCQHGIGAITASPDVLVQLLDHEVTDQAVEDFTQDFYDQCGDGKTMLDC
ncbi:TPA: fructose-6-phosphate aldolase [Candidatus Sumerlaeota bacterium]|jgi:TalC/MipB family fructose-6-phosphate aldolase|nr:fructose-6-phosphate aldolase [Candidatus Sumerlaeota bacterium]